ncbi:MAG: DUF1553 domain-containing protein [Planctomycetes bacterium]|nr:DUF1553 domain-containing protein [Planctomycetota bacterium]
MTILERRRCVILAVFSIGLMLLAALSSPIGAADRDANNEHWAFRGVVAPDLQLLQTTAWDRSTLDLLLRETMVGRGFRPAAEAEPWQLVRRVSFDLTGLPADIDLLDEYESSPLPDRFEQLFDRLVASPGYGERWGRHWLDIARYADSNGLDENVAHGNAWRYRDYVVRSLNQDKPWDRFVLEQLAGDLLPAASDEERHELLTATGFLAIGPKVLAEVDETKMELDIVDEQVDTVGKALLGMTIGCARCHDHKFDPLGTADYYALAGIFKSTKTMENLKKVAKWHENPLMTPELAARKAEFETRLQQQRESIQKVVQAAEETIRAQAENKEQLPKNLEPMFPAPVAEELKKLREQLTTMEKEGPPIPSAMGVAEGTLVDLPIHVRGSHLTLGEIVRRGIPSALGPISAAPIDPASSGRMELARWLASDANALARRVVVNRLWRWHFGRGLVRTTDNFGLLGESPSHPELLEWLVLQFARDGSSWKRFHRRILTSATYQQSSLAAPDKVAKDPENELFSRFPLRRLEAESIRDALLFVSGSLDRRMGGSLLTVKNREYFFDHTSKDLTDYRSPRRSLYLPVVRNNVYDVFQLLDYPDAAVPNGDRATTTIAPQALWMMNSEFVAEVSAQCAATACGTGSADEKQTMTGLVRRLFQRPAADGELEALQRFLGELRNALAVSESDEANRVRLAWSTLCHTLMASNEFVYVP